MNQPLYQCVVETSGGQPMAVGPKVDQATAERFARSISVGIIRGIERAWSNPHVVPVIELRS